MMKAGAIGRLGHVTKLLQTQRRESQWHMQHFVNRGALVPYLLLQRAHMVSGPGVSPTGNFQNYPRRNRRRKTGAAAAGKKCDASTSQSKNFWRQS